jgi:hypothetical protein
MRALSGLFLCTLTACESEASKQAKEAQRAVSAVSAESTKAAVGLPLTDKWDAAHLVQRLVRSGLAPQEAPELKGQKYWSVPVHAFHVGPNILFVYLYADSTARRSVTSDLDTLTIAPRGMETPYDPRHILIIQNNLAAVMVGGTEAQQERVRLALEAGLPMPAKK